MTLQERFNPQQLIASACAEAGSDDFGEDGWQPGLDRVADGLVNEARLSPIGVEVAYLDIMRALKNRLDVIAWRKQHPEIAAEPITAPIRMSFRFMILLMFGAAYAARSNPGAQLRVPDARHRHGSPCTQLIPQPR